MSHETNPKRNAGKYIFTHFLFLNSSAKSVETSLISQYSTLLYAPIDYRQGGGAGLGKT